MNQEPRHFLVQAPMGRPRLASRGFDSDNHIAQKLPSVVAVITFEQRKCQDVGRGTLARCSAFSAAISSSSTIAIESSEID